MQVLTARNWPKKVTQNKIIVLGTKVSIMIDSLSIKFVATLNNFKNGSRNVSQVGQIQFILSLCLTDCVHVKSTGAIFAAAISQRSSTVDLPKQKHNVKYS